MGKGTPTVFEFDDVSLTYLVALYKVVATINSPPAVKLFSAVADDDDLINIAAAVAYRRWLWHGSEAEAGRAVVGTGGEGEEEGEDRKTRQRRGRWRLILYGKMY